MKLTLNMSREWYECEGCISRGEASVTVEGALGNDATITFRMDFLLVEPVLDIYQVDSCSPQPQGNAVDHWKVTVKRDGFPEEPSKGIVEITVLADSWEPVIDGESVTAVVEGVLSQVVMT